MHKFVVGMMIFAISYNLNADTYDPATNKLFIPSITVEGTVYSDVYVTVGEILSIGSAVPQKEQNERTCSFTLDGTTDRHRMKYDLTVLPSSKAIRVSMIGLDNSAYFDSYSISIVQGSNSTDLTTFEQLEGSLWVGDYGFSMGSVPEGVVKGGVVSRLPDWLDLNLPFKWLVTDEEHIC